METRQFDSDYIDAELQRLTATLTREEGLCLAGGFVMAMLELRAETRDYTWWQEMSGRRQF